MCLRDFVVGPRGYMGLFGGLNIFKSRYLIVIMRKKAKFSWKEFLKPTKWKIGIITAIFVFVELFLYNEYGSYYAPLSFEEIFISSNIIFLPILFIIYTLISAVEFYYKK